MKILYRSLIVFSALLAFSQPTIRVFGCSDEGGDDENISFYFDPHVVNSVEYEPILYSQHLYFSSAWLGDSAKMSHNAFEWAGFCDNAPSVGDVSNVVYELSADTLALVRDYVERGAAVPNRSLELNSLIRYWKNHGSEPRTSGMIDYLLFAKACEPLVSGYWDWDSPEKERRIAATRFRKDSLTVAGIRSYDMDLPVELKLRYAYQLVRLTQYANDPDRASRLYDSLVLPLRLKHESVIQYWALGNKAGALQALGNEAEASYLFSIVFDKCPDRRHEALQSFRIRNDSVFRSCLEKCRSDHERATLYFLQALDFRSNALEQMRAIYALEPGSERLEVLLAREIVKIESELSQWHGRTQRDPGISDARKYAFEIHEFVQRCLDEHKVRTRKAWLLALGYSEYLAGLLPEARAEYAAMRPSLGEDQQLLSLLNVFDLAAQVESISDTGRAVEDSLFTAVEKTGHKLLLRSFEDKLCALYAKYGMATKEFLCMKGIEALRAKPTISRIDSVLNILHNRGKSAFEVHLLQAQHGAERDRYYTPSFYAYDTDIEGFLQEMRATVFLSENRLDEAIAIFERLQGFELEPLRVDPFESHLRDCRDCDFGHRYATTYSKLTLAKRLRALEKQVDEGTQDAGMDHFLLGTAWYNMSYFGSSAEAIDYQRSPGGMGYYGDDDTSYVDCSRAHDHFEAAQLAFEESGDHELAARSAFMVAKCQRNDYYLNPMGSQERSDRYRSFQLLMKAYAKTKLYEEALTECEAFRYYAEAHGGDTVQIRRTELFAFIERFSRLFERRNGDGYWACYADTVRYYDRGTITRQEVLKDRRVYLRSFDKIVMSPNIKSVKILDVNGVTTVTYRVTFSVHDPKRAITLSGEAENTLGLRKSGRVYSITAERSKVLSRKRAVKD